MRVISVEQQMVQPTCAGERAGGVEGETNQLMAVRHGSWCTSTGSKWRTRLPRSSGSGADDATPQIAPRTQSTVFVKSERSDEHRRETKQSKAYVIKLATCETSANKRGDITSPLSIPRTTGGGQVPSIGAKLLESKAVEEIVTSLQEAKEH